MVKLYKYGTSGFRYNASVMMQICEKIGIGIGLLIASINKKKSHAINLGLMITGSHNPHSDNGIKIIDGNGYAISPEHEIFLENVVNSDNVTDLSLQYDIPPSIKIIIGNDTRESCASIKIKLLSGIRSVIDVSVIDIGFKTTPEFHVCVYKYNSFELDSFKSCRSQYHRIHADSTIGFDFDTIPHTKDTFYTRYIKSIISQYNINTNDTIIDCANGVGTITLQNIFDTHYPKLINTDTHIFTKLNNGCGADYIITNPVEYYENIKKNNIIFDYYLNKLCAAFDGDADRIVFYYYDKFSIRIMNGDHINCLILNYILDVLSFNEITCSINIGIIHTNYTNRGYIKYLDELKKKIHDSNPSINILTDCTSIGVKHLMSKINKYDISIFYESNGHGSVIINKHFGIDGLINLSRIFNHFTGDAITNFIGIKYILDKMKFTCHDFYNLFTPIPSINSSINIKNIFNYVMCNESLSLIRPKQLVDDVQIIMDNNKKTSCAIYIRPSGTENKLRIYIENNSIDKLDNLLQDVIDIVTVYEDSF